MKRLVLPLCLLTVVFNLHSESVYTYDLKKDIALSALSIGVNFSQYLLANPDRIPSNLNRNNVNIFDRGLMFPYNETLHIIRDYYRFVLPVLPIITPLAGDIRKDFDTWLTYGFMYTQASLLTIGTTGLIWRSVYRNRPRQYFWGAAEHPIDGDSFPSDTVAFSFLSATFLSVTFSKEYPESLWKIPVIVGSYTLATGIGVLSVLSGMHFLTDVLAAAVIGSFYGWLIPTIHIKTNNENGISFYFTGNGVIISLKL